MVGNEDNPYFTQFMKICDGVRKLGVRANADNPDDAAKARAFGAEGIGLFRTEHMFYGKGSEQPLFLLRKMICSSTVEERRKALDELFPFIKSDVKGTLEAMDGLPVTIRLLDPPLHEFVPHREDERQKLAEALGITLEDLAKRADALHESNPMMGHRGVRLGITYPEISETLGARHLRGGGGADQGRQEGHPGDHDPRHLRREGTRAPGRAGEEGPRRNGRQVQGEEDPVHCTAP